MKYVVIINVPKRCGNECSDRQNLLTFLYKQGTGLGLSYVILKVHGSEITVESKIDEGI